MKLWPFLFFFSFLFSCLLPGNLSRDSTPLITMKRTPCYGECPQYMINIYESGLLVYHGFRFVSNIGCVQSNISSKQINYIKLLLDEIQFFDLDEEYISDITDIPSVITEVFIHGNRHRVVDRLKAPKKLKNLYRELDLIVDTISNWEACDELDKVD
tara:strand:- start:370 stop:840 length:471 start_codon:yes stop_codon:yes gene_type:complete